jgi:hypothetical protein
MLMNLRVTAVLGAALCAAALPSWAFDSAIPPSGLPSAADYGAQLLPEMLGVVSWKTLAQVEPVKQGAKVVPQFSREILGLDAKDVRVQGFIIPLEMGDKQKHFLLSAVPPHWSRCTPASRWRTASSRSSWRADSRCSRMIRPACSTA